MADGEGLAQYSETVEISDDDMTKEIILKKKEKQVVCLYVRNGESGEDLSGVIIRFKKKTSRHVSEGVTDDNGVWTVFVDDFGNYQIEAEKKGFINSRLEFGFTKVNKDLNQIAVIMLPVEKPISQKVNGEELPAVRLRIISYIDHKHDSGPPSIHFKSYEGEEHSEKIVYPDQEIYEENFTLIFKRAGNANWYYGEIETNRDEWLRIYSPIQGLKEPTYEEIDQFSIANLKIPEARFTLYSDNRELGKVSPSLSAQYGPVWDIGILNPVQKKFLQTNFFVNDGDLKRKEMLKPYFRFIKYLNNQNEYYNFSIIFGFNEGIFKFDDYHIKPIDFYSRLKALDVDWVNPDLPEGEKQEEEKLESEFFFNYLSGSLTNILGEIALKRVTERFGPHLGLALKK